MIEVPVLKMMLRVSPESTAEDDLIAQLEAIAVERAQRETGYYAGPVVSTGSMYAQGFGTSTLWLPEPISTGTPTVQERAYTGGSATAVTDFVVRNGHLVRTNGALWRSGYEYEVIGTRGYAAGEEPAEIRKYVMDLVSFWFEHRTLDDTDARLPEPPYRRPVFA